MGNTSGGMMSLLARNTNTNLQVGAANLLKRTRNALLAFSFIAFQVFSPVAIVSAQANTEINDDNAGNRTISPSAVVDYTPAPNPPLGQSCGLDVALVIDNSTSISASELSTMKTAMTAFTSAFSGTPTQFSVTRFATTGAVLQGFTANTAAVNTAINSIPAGGGFTNWEDGLLKAQSTFDPRPTVPNMVIFASDGNPNRVDNGTDVSEAQAVNEAILVANALKQSPTNAHMLALGIGNDLDVANLEKVSGAGDVITSGFDTLAEDLAELANTLCGGTITTTKIIDQDGNLNTVNDQTPAQNWSFDIDGAPSNPNATVTDANGQTPAVKVDAGTYSVNETQQTGYQLLSASCTGATNNGSVQGNSVTGISVANNNIVSCTFINSPKPKLIVKKHVINDNGGTKSASDFTMTVTGNPKVVPNFPGSESGTEITLNNGSFSVNELSDSGYSKSFSGDCSGTISAGETKTCTITNDDIAPKLTVVKNVVNPYGSSLPASSFPLFVNGNIVTSGAQNAFNVGSHTISETQQTGYSFTGISGDCSLNQDTISVLLSLANNYTCTLTNTAIQPKLVVIKHVIGGTKSADKFTMTVSGNSQDVDDFKGSEAGVVIGLNEGNYTVNEVSDPEYSKSFSGDCSGTITIGETKTCTITNTFISDPKIEIIKSGPSTAHEGDNVTYDFEVTNTGNVDLTNVTVMDDIVDGLVRTFSGNGNNILEVGEIWRYQATYTIPANQTANVLNTVEACGSEYTNNVDIKSVVIPKGDICDTDDHELDVLHPSIQVVKNGPASAEAGSTVRYSFAVTNTGDTPLSDVTVVDSITADPTYVSGDVDNDDQLDLTETWVFTVDYVIPTDQTADVVNTATTCGYDSEKEVENEVDSFGLLRQEAPRVAVCDDDSHTLKITVPVVPAEEIEEVLAPAGAPQTMLITLAAVLNITLAVGALSLARRRLYSN